MAKKESNSFKAKVFTFLKGLFNNDAIISTSRTSKWWAGLITAVISAFIPVVPIMVQQANSYGASFLKGVTNGFDTYLVDATMELKAGGYEFKVNNEHKLEMYKDGSLVSQHTTPTTPIFTYTSTRTYQDENGVKSTYDQKEFEVYFSTDPVNDKTSENTVSSLLKYLESDENKYVLGSTTVYTPVEGEEKPVLYTPSYLVLYQEGIYTAIKKDASTDTSAATTYTSDWKNTPVGTELLANALDVNDVTADIKSQEYVDAVMGKWSTYYNQAYKTQKAFNTWFSTLVYFGIYVVLIFFMGLMLFLLTRGKRNMFNYLTFLDTQKMAWWEAFSPALLSLILGFMFSQYAMMLFILLLGLRTMWMSMRQLRPAM